MAQTTPPPVGIIGGTGKLGLALAARLAAGGRPVVLGSRVAGRAEVAARTVAERLGPREHATLTGLDNAAAAATSAVVLIAVPYASVVDTVGPLADAIADRIVVSTVVPAEFVRGGPPRPLEVPQGSAAEQLARLLPAARVVGALQTVSYRTLRDLDRPLDDDIIVTGDDDDAKRTVADLLGVLGPVRAIDGGPLRNARFVEQLTVLLLSVNTIYGGSTGVRITNIDGDAFASRGFLAGHRPAVQA